MITDQAATLCELFLVSLLYSISSLSLCQQQTPLPASSNLFGRPGNSSLHHSYVHHDFGHQSKPCHSALLQIDSQQTFYHWEKIGKRCQPCAILRRYHTLLTEAKGKLFFFCMFFVSTALCNVLRIKRQYTQMRSEEHTSEL